MAAVEFTKSTLQEICQKDGLYRTASLNDKLYLHYRGFKKIDGTVLGEYSGLRCLWLQGNSLVKIEGLENLTQLRTLCLHENVIDTIQGLETLVLLQSLNLSKNFIRNVENLSKLTKLESLDLGHNSIGPDATQLEHLLELPSLQTLDIQANRLEEGEKVLGIVKRLESLRVLYCMGNPFVKSVRHYRKRFVSATSELRYLDDRPVFEDERRRCSAWSAALAVQGASLEDANAAERDEIQKIREERRLLDRQRIKDFETMIRNAKENALPPPPDKNSQYVDVDELD
ncbi:hypothetical protein CTAYLR_004307 [Chrysophaeum taylorii]|uniref:Dynein assembly factor 1, axonemal homolog n=1 Tax=Chrysophaeum taylorii TaxID=2483200 RepID=A0AAD7UFX6_9STRA|nr:hypothetical protein CTAYLR_004307 [Chrysophaeum taylorii]